MNCVWYSEIECLLIEICYNYYRDNLTQKSITREQFIRLVHLLNKNLIEFRFLYLIYGLSSPIFLMKITATRAIILIAFISYKRLDYVDVALFVHVMGIHSLLNQHGRNPNNST